MRNIIKWIIIGLGTLCVLWIAGVLVKFGAAVLWLVTLPFILIAKLFFSHSILGVILVFGIICWYFCRRRKSTDTGQPTWDTRVTTLDHRLDRLNEILSRRS